MSTATEDTPRSTLYVFPAGSVWSAPVLLAAAEKGLNESSGLLIKTVNLLKGENFSPAFLKISPKGTVPALVAPYEHTTSSDLATKYKALTDTTSIASFLDTSTLRTSTHSAPSLSPMTVQGSADSSLLIEHVHSPAGPDPNFLLLSFRNDEERKAKYGDLVGEFLKGRQEALERYAKEAGDGDARLAAFYEAKIKENGGLLGLYEGKGDPTSFIGTSLEAWKNLGKTVELVESKLTATYLVGDQLSLADLHVGAFFARIFAVSGAKSLADVDGAISALEGQLKQKIGDKFKAWWTALTERESFKSVYADGLH